METIYSDDQPRRPEWTLVGYLNLPNGVCNVWQKDDDENVVVMPESMAPWSSPEDVDELTRPEWVITSQAEFMPESTAPDPDPADWGFETDA